MKYLSKNLQDDSEKEGSFNPDWMMTWYMLHVHVSVSFAKYGTLTALTIFGHKRGAHEFVEGDRSFWGYA